MGRLAGKVALVTGGAGGFGQAIARAFVAEGANVVLSDLDGDAASTAARAVDDTGKRAIGLPHDVTSEEDWRRVLAQTQETFSALHVLVNNAGIAEDGSIEDTTLADFRRMQAVHVDGTFIGCQLGLPLLKAAGDASIINMSSVAGIIASPSMVAYATAKAAVRHMTKVIALLCAQKRYDVRCNSVHPAFVRTPLLDPLVERYGEKTLDRFAAQIPMGRLGTPREIADVCVFLASSESSFMTGSELVVDGGISAM